MLSTQNLLAIVGKIGDNEDYLHQLLDQLKTPIGVIPFVGAGLSMPFGFPGWANFLIIQAERAGIKGKIKHYLRLGKYEEAAEDLLNSRGYRAFHDAIKNTFGAHRLINIDLKGGAVLLLPQLTAGPIITTNFDYVLEKAFKQAKRSFERVVWGVKADSATQSLHQNRRFLLKIHGDAEDSTERILTKSDYQKYYGRLDGEEISFSLPLPRLLQQMLIGRPLLFIGCSLNKDRTVAVLEKVARSNRSIAHYAIVEQSKSLKQFHERSRYLSEHNIRPIWYPQGRHKLIISVLEGLISLASPSTQMKALKAESVTVDKLIIDTNRVRFETERKPNEIDLIRAINTILATRSHEKPIRIPLDYDPQIFLLVEKLEALYRDFESLMRQYGETPSASTFSQVREARSFVHNRLDNLPDVLGLAVIRLSQASLNMNDVSITTMSSRFIELVLTEVIFSLIKRQFSEDPSKILAEYAGVPGIGLDKYIAHIDGVQVDNIIDYRIQFYGDYEERSISVPLSYARDGLIVYREFNKSERGYIPPISFMTKYVFPQMLWWNWNKPDNWNFEWKCQSVFVKNREGDYLDQDGRPW